MHMTQKRKNNLDEKTQILNPSFKIKITIFERKNTDIKTSLKTGTYLIKKTFDLLKLYVVL